MYGKIKRDKEYINGLKKSLEKDYGFSIQEMYETKRGWYGETWRVKTDKDDLFVKIDNCKHHKRRYKESLFVIEYLHANGIHYISKVIKTKKESLNTTFQNGIVGVFEFVEGENTEDYPISKLYEKMALIYKVPAQGLHIEKENFKPGKILNAIDRYIVLLASSDNLQDRKLLKVLEGHRGKIEFYHERLQGFAKLCRKDTSDFVITHSDAGGNVIINGDEFTIIDWDHPMLAPIERDVWPFSNQMESIQKALKKHNVSYNPNPCRLAYYTYFMFFFYLMEMLQAFFDIEEKSLKRDTIKAVKDLPSGWIKHSLERANQISLNNCIFRATSIRSSK